VTLEKTNMEDDRKVMAIIVFGLLFPDNLWGEKSLDEVIMLQCYISSLSDLVSFRPI